MNKLKISQKTILEAVRHPVIRGTFWKLSARIFSLVLQSTYFLLVARSLGAEQYGLFVGVMALIKLPVAFANWGTPHILVKHVSRDNSLLQKYWGNALTITATLGTIVLSILLLLNQYVLTTSFPFLLIVVVGLAELVFARVHDAALKACISTDFFNLDALLNTLLSVNGLIAAVCLSRFFPSPTALTWGLLYLISRAITALIGYWVIHWKFGPPQPDLSLMKPEIFQGFYFAVDLSSQSIYNDIDKTMLASMSTLDATGIYGAAYRIIEVGMIPIMAVLGASYAQFFRKGSRGIQGSLELARRIVPAAAVYGVFATILLWLFAPVIPFLLGSEFQKSVDALRWLSPLVFFKSLQYFAANTLTGAGLQGARSALQAGVAGFNVLINIWLIPAFSWLGAAWSSLATDGLLMITLWGLVLFFHYSETRLAKSNLR